MEPREQGSQTLVNCDCLWNLSSVRQQELTHLTKFNNVMRNHKKKQELQMVMITLKACCLKGLGHAISGNFA